MLLNNSIDAFPLVAWRELKGDLGGCNVTGRGSQGDRSPCLLIFIISQHGVIGCYWFFGGHVVGKHSSRESLLCLRTLK